MLLFEGVGATGMGREPPALRGIEEGERRKAGPRNEWNRLKDRLRRQCVFHVDSVGPTPRLPSQDH